MLFLEVTEGAVTAGFIPKQYPKEKLPFVSKAIQKLDILKFFLMTLWEVHGIDTKKYIALSEDLNDTGKQLGGWKNKLIKETQTPQERG